MALALAWLSGCATTPMQRLNPPPPYATPTIGLWQSSELSPTLLHDLVEARSSPPTDPAAASRSLIQHATRKAQLELSGQLAQIPGIRIDPTPFQLPPSLQLISDAPFSSIAGPALNNLQHSHPGTDLLLRLEITDYGWTPTAWRSNIVTYGVVTTLGITAFFYAQPATRALAGIYLVNDAKEEGLEAYSGFSGFWVIDKMYRPVRVHCNLVDLHNGVVLWDDVETGFSDGRWPHLIGAIPQDQQSQQLDQSLHRAMEKLVRTLRASVL